MSFWDCNPSSNSLCIASRQILIWVHPNFQLFNALHFNYPRESPLSMTQSCKPAFFKTHVNLPFTQKYYGMAEFQNNHSCAKNDGVQQPLTVIATCIGKILVRPPWVMAGFSYIGLGNVLQWNTFMFDIFSSSPNIKAINSHNPLKMEWSPVTLRLKFKSFLPLIYSHSCGNGHQEWFCSHYLWLFSSTYPGTNDLLLYPWKSERKWALVL